LYLRKIGSGVCVPITVLLKVNFSRSGYFLSLFKTSNALSPLTHSKKIKMLVS